MTMQPWEKSPTKKILNSFLKPGPAILLGTQMVAKGPWILKM
ncbi:MAG: hypothetical protein U5N58_10665 [Actinomycetota bacterium]|nr:hypothetical protein [Actinomycetota bacterium]